MIIKLNEKPTYEDFKKEFDRADREMFYSVVEMKEINSCFIEITGEEMLNQAMQRD